MPCGNLDHEHPPWPQQGAHEFVIEACENRCGWCGYQTKKANNLRVHARRHLTNESETTLRRIKIVKGKAGRKKVQMAKRWFPGSEACDKNPSRSPSVELLNNGMKADQPGIGLEENRSREHPSEALHPPPPAFTPRTQIPPRLLHYEDEYSSLNYPPRTRNEYVQLPLPIASMDISSPFKTNRTQTHGQRMPNENEAGDAETSGLSLRAIDYIERLILQPLAYSSYELPNYCDKIIVGIEIICLRDLENDLLHVPNTVSWKTTDQKIDFALLVIQCIKETVPFLDYRELVRPTDQPYNERYFMEVEASLKARYQLPGVSREKESGFNRGVGQERPEELSRSIRTLHGADTQVGSTLMTRSHRLEERRGPQERDTNEIVLDIEGLHPWTPSNLQSIQEAPNLPEHSTQNGAAQLPDPGISDAILHCLKDMGYSEAELHEYFEADLFATIDSRLLPKPSPAFSQSQNDPFEYQIANSQEIQTKASKFSDYAFHCIHKQILLPLLRRPSLREFRTLVLVCAGNIYTSGFETLRDVETYLFALAPIRAKSDISYLRFCNFLLRCIRSILNSENGSLSDDEKTRQDQSTYSEAHFTELSERIHREAARMESSFGWAADERWRSCLEPQCSFRQGVASKAYWLVHLQEYHNEDVGCTCEEELAGRSLDPLSWRCLNCLFQNFRSQNGYLCGHCKVPCEEFRIKARAKLAWKENGMGTIQQDSPSAHASTIASSQSIEQGETSFMGSPAMESGSPILSESEKFLVDVIDAAIASRVASMPVQPTSPEKSHQVGGLGANQSSGSYDLATLFFCVGNEYHFGSSTSTEYELHLENYHNVLVIFLSGKWIYLCQSPMRVNPLRKEARCRADFSTLLEVLQHQENIHGLKCKLQPGTFTPTGFNPREGSSGDTNTSDSTASEQTREQSTHLE